MLSMMQEPQMQEREEHILVVDDDALTLKVAEDLLKGKYRVSCVKSGEEALDFLEKEMPDLLLLDLHMKGMDGFDVLRFLNRSKITENLPVVFLTAEDDQKAEIRGFREGVQDYIRKPFVAEIMIQRVQRVLELSRLQKNLREEVKRQTYRAEERRRKVEQMSLQTIYTLASAIDAKDKYTKGHSSRVSEYSTCLARALGYSEEELNNLRHIALLHDIGKISIPDSILNKPGRLSNTEFEIIKGHAQAGGEILDNISMMPDIKVGARHHHERWDGRGYPDGLRGRDIPEVARIICIADAYDAMNSRRVYRNALPKEVIRHELVEGSGVQFDPMMTEVFLKLFDEGKLDEINKEFNASDSKGIDLLLRDVIASEDQTGERERDMLTGLMLRAEGEQAINDIMYREGGCLCLFDVDNLKRINDSLGHLNGDHLLQKGGDEFVLFIPGADEKKGANAAAEIIQSFNARREEDVMMQAVSLSAGICACRQRADYQQVLENADKALYFVKQSGKANFHIYVQEQEPMQAVRSSDMNVLIQGIENGGNYSGALDVEYRMFTKLYEYMKNLDKRYSQETTLALITLDAKRGTDINEQEKAMSCMERAIRSTIRSTDVFSRYSAVQFLVILVQPGGEGDIKAIMRRIMNNYVKFYGSTAIGATYEFASMIQENEKATKQKLQQSSQ